MVIASHVCQQSFVKFFLVKSGRQLLPGDSEGFAFSSKFFFVLLLSLPSRDGAVWQAATFKISYDLVPSMAGGVAEVCRHPECLMELHASSPSLKLSYAICI